MLVDLINEDFTEKLKFFDPNYREVDLNVDDLGNGKYIIKASVDDKKEILTNKDKSDSGRLINIEFINDYEKEINLEMYPKLLKTTIKAVTNYSDEISKKYLACTKKNNIDNTKDLDEENYKDKKYENSSDYDLMFEVAEDISVSENELGEIELSTRESNIYEPCYKEIFDNLIKQYSNEVFNLYDFQVKELREVNEIDSNYVGVKISAKEKKTKEKVIEFGVIIEDKIPFEFVNFEISNNNAISGTVDLKIDLPTFNNNVNNYIILYSNYNFLDKSNQEFRNTLDDLNENDYENFYDTKVGVDKYYYFDKSNVNMIITSNTDFVSNEVDKKSTKKISIFQKYNKEKKIYELFNQNEQVYFMVYAVDRKHNFLLEDSQLRVKSISISKNTDILSPTEENLLKIDGAPGGYQNSIYIDIKNYTDSNKLNLYIFKEGEYEKACINYDFNNFCKQDLCYSSEIEIFDKNSFNVFIDTDRSSNNDGDLKFDNVLYGTSSFNSELYLENNKKYDVVLVGGSVDGDITSEINCRRVGAKKPILNSVNPKTGFQSYSLPNSDYTEMVIPYIKKSLLIVDKKIPTINDISYENKLVFKNSNLFFNWQVVGGNVDEVEAVMNVYLKNNQKKVITKTFIGKSGVNLGINQEDISKIEFAQMILVDRGGSLDKNKFLKSEIINNVGNINYP